MPCYCDTPDASDQLEIEKRCKENMYFAAQNLMSDKQIQDSINMGLSRFPAGISIDYSFVEINDDLCKICSILTNEQMKRISARYFEIKWNHKTLYEWYEHHKKQDLQFN